MTTHGTQIDTLFGRPHQEAPASRDDPLDWLVIGPLALVGLLWWPLALMGLWRR